MADIIHTLQNLRGGGALFEANDKLTQAVKAVKETAKPATFTIKIKIAPNGRQGELTDDISVTLPQPDKEKTLMFFDDNGGLSRRDPNQKSIPFKDVTAPDDDAEAPLALPTTPTAPKQLPAQPAAKAVGSESSFTTKAVMPAPPKAGGAKASG